jgi:putative ABC transport system permease protein
LLRSVRRLQRGVALSAGGIAGLALVLGGTTLMSLLIAGVLERVPEIGLRRALGGTPRDVAALFVAEACAVTTAAGVLGVLGAMALMPALERAAPIPVRTGPLSVILPLAFSILAGVAFSWWPARRAACIPPSEALRSG